MTYGGRAARGRGADLALDLAIGAWYGYDNHHAVAKAVVALRADARLIERLA